MESPKQGYFGIISGSHINKIDINQQLILGAVVIVKYVVMAIK